MVTWKAPLSLFRCPWTSLPTTVTSLTCPCCASCRNSDHAISCSLPGPALFWKSCHKTTRQAKIKTQKMIVLTVEFTKETSFLSNAGRKENRTAIFCRLRGKEQYSHHPSLHALDAAARGEVSNPVKKHAPFGHRQLDIILLPRGRGGSFQQRNYPAYSGGEL